MTRLKQAFLKVAEVELVYRNKRSFADRPKVTTSRDAYELFLYNWNADKLELQEQFRVMLLDRSGRCLGISTISTGGISECPVDVRLVFATALKARASSIILAHNHPSGESVPSEQDRSLTRHFALAGKLLGMPVLDHIVVTRQGYTSLADDGVLDTAPG